MRLWNWSSLYSLALKGFRGSTHMNHSDTKRRTIQMDLFTKDDLNMLMKKNNFDLSKTASAILKIFGWRFVGFLTPSNR